MTKQSVSLLCGGLMLLVGGVFGPLIRHEWVAAHGAKTSLFAPYPHSAQFDYFVREGHGQGEPPGDRLFFATWFLDGQPGIAMEYYLDASGKGGTVREVYANGMQNEGFIQLNAKAVHAIDSSLRSLPPSSAHPPLDRLLIFSYRSGSTWVTRLYDRKHLPVRYCYTASFL